MELFGVPATVRASFGMYNTKQEIDALASCIERVKEMLG
jgi:cysteine desulfurase/selenocysteine lyase